MSSNGAIPTENGTIAHDIEMGAISEGYITINGSCVYDIPFDREMYMIECFVKISETQSKIIAGNDYTFEISSDRVKIGNGSNWVITDNLAFPTNKWVQLGISVSKDSVKLFLNGAICRIYSNSIANLREIGIFGENNSFQHLRVIGLVLYNTNYQMYSDFSFGAYQENLRDTVDKFTGDLLSLYPMYSGYINSSGNISSPDYANETSHFIPVVSGATYQFSVTPVNVNVNTSHLVGYCFYDSNFKLIGSRTVIHNSTIGSFKVPNNANIKYIRIGARFIANGGNMTLRGIL